MLRFKQKLQYIVHFKLRREKESQERSGEAPGVGMQCKLLDKDCSERREQEQHDTAAHHQDNPARRHKVQLRMVP